MKELTMRYIMIVYMFWHYVRFSVGADIYEGTNYGVHYDVIYFQVLTSMKELATGCIMM